MNDEVLGPIEKRRRGRPPGQKMKVAAEVLRHSHFSFIRHVLDLGDDTIREAWERYLAFEGGPNDERHFRARLRQLAKIIRIAAVERDLGHKADLALADLDLSAAVREEAQDTTKGGETAGAGSALPSPMAAIPTLDEWVEDKVASEGLDADFYSQREWMELYQSEFGLDQPDHKVAATSLVEEKPLKAVLGGKAPHPALLTKAPKIEKINALAVLTVALAKPPALTDGLGTWLTKELASRFAKTAVKGKPLPLLTVGNLIDFVNLHHNRWWVHVPRIGEDRAERIITWLASIGEQLGRPVRESVLRPKRRMELSAEAAILDKGGQVQPTFGLVPLYRLAVPSELNGSVGRFRAPGENVLGADQDIQAITKWLQRYQKSPRTFESYGAIVERFYLWSLLERRLAMSSLTEEDIESYAGFMAKPPLDWIQTRQTPRNSKDWRPFRKPLSAQSRQLNMTVISSMLKSLTISGYLRANAAAGVVPQVKNTLLKIQIDRSFDEAQWAYVMGVWKRDYEACGPMKYEGEEKRILPDEAHPDLKPALAAAMRRTLLVLELGATTSLRLIELTTTRQGALTREVVDGQAVWLMKVLGKGNKEREVIVFDDVKALIDQHRADMERAGIGFDPGNKHLHVLRPDAVVEGGSGGNLEQEPSDSGEPVVEGPDPAMYPIIGALKKRPPPWVLDKNGVATIDRQAPGNADRYGALEPSALYQALKRFLVGCAKRAREEGEPIDADKLERASTHWLRHFFANNAVADGVALGTVRDMMGHASIATTSIYLRTERRAMVKEMAKVKRRS